MFGSSPSGPFKSVDLFSLIFSRLPIHGVNELLSKFVLFLNDFFF